MQHCQHCWHLISKLKKKNNSSPNSSCLFRNQKDQQSTIAECSICSSATIFHHFAPCLDNCQRQSVADASLSKAMSRLIKLLLLAQVSLSTCLAAWAPLNPEETLYVYTSCFDEWAPKDGTQRKAVAETWFKSWDLKPDNPGTHCFAKCVLEGVGLYDEKTNTMAVIGCYYFFFIWIKLFNFISGEPSCWAAKGFWEV